jgi:thiamine-phosphate pyrophosphorylase
MCGDAGVLFLVNDRVRVAIRCGAAGAHIGQDDDAAIVREQLGPERILGVSVGNVREASSAESAGADYLGVTVWATDTKPDAIPVGLDGLRAVARATSLPVVGIGGVDARNARDALTAGAAGVAAVSAVAAAVDPVLAVRELREVVDGYYEETT